MRRFFLSGQTTCALLLGAGLLLRAQTALNRPETAPQARLEAPRPRPAELFGERAPRLVRAPLPTVAPAEQRLQADSQFRKERRGFIHESGRHKGRKCGGVALASRQFGCG
jgi:hypothetical protein